MEPYNEDPQFTYGLSEEDKLRLTRYEEEQEAQEAQRKLQEVQQQQLANDQAREDAFNAEEARKASQPSPRDEMPYAGSFPGQPEAESKPEPEPEAEQGFQYPGMPSNFQEYLDQQVTMRTAPIKGVGDFVADTVSLLPWLKPAGDWWDEKTGRKQASGTEKFIRDTAGTLVPMLFGYGAVAKPLSALNKVQKLSKTGKAIDITGKALLNLGIGTGINVISETTDEAGNLSSMIQDFTNIGMPLSTYDSDSPDDIKTKNVLEGVIVDSTFGSAEIIGAGIKLLKNKLSMPRDIISVDDLVRELEEPFDEMVRKVELKADAVDEEAVRRFQADPEGVTGRDAFVNEPAEAQERYMPNSDADMVNFMVDNDRIENNIGTVDGRARPAITEHMKDDFLAADTVPEVEAMVDQLAGEMEVNVTNMIGDIKRSPEDIKLSIDKMAARVFTTDPTEMAADVQKLMVEGESIWGNSVKTLTKDGQMELENAITTAIEIMNPGKRKARSVLAMQAGGDIVDTSRAIKFIGEEYNTARHQELAMKNLGILMKASRQARYIDGYRLQMNNLIKKAKASGETITAEWFNERNEAFAAEIKNGGEKTLEFINTLVDVSNSNPEYFKPLYEQFAKTNGDIDTLDKLGKLVENRLGFWRKAFYDGNKEVPSLLVKEMDAVRYNNLLNGLAPIRALAGASIGLTGKPLTQMAGFAADLDFKGLGDSFKVFGGVVENFRRALKYAGEEWRYTNQNPDFASQRIREDYQASNLDDFDTLEQMSGSWFKNGEYGKVGAWNLLKVTAFFNRQSWNRWGINSMTAIDGFVKSMNASMVARQRAMKEVYDTTNGAWDEALFNAKQRELYDAAFDKNGLLTDTAAKYASGEINLNLDTQLTSGIEGIINQFPIARSIFMFPRTGVNAVSLVSTFNPAGALGLSVGKARKVLKAKPDSPQAAEALMEHGFDAGDMDALRRLKSEYKGRYLMGSAVTMGAALMAFQGNLTGSGPANEAMKRDMMLQGWEPYSIKIFGEWRSYQGLEPFDTFLGLVADIVFEGQRLDQSVTEDFFRTLTHSISQNIANKTFLSGFKPLADLTSLQNEGAWQRFVASAADSYIPGTGVRSILSKAIVPQLKDVNYSWQEHLANRNRWLPPVNAELVDALDIYTGERINWFDPITAGINAVLPFGKTNGGLEPWRQELLRTGWTGQKRLRINPDTGEQFTPEQRQYMNNWIAEHSPLGPQIEELFSKSDKWWRADLKKFAKAKGLKPKNLMDIKKTAIHQYLSDIHDNAYKNAYDALKLNDETVARQAQLKGSADMEVEQGNYERAADSAQQFLDTALK